MFWKKKIINSSEYLELLEKINKLNVRISGLEIDLQLYVKKLRATKGFKDLRDEQTEDLKNSMLLPE